MMALGVAGQTLFFARTGWQWVASERAGRVVVPSRYWELSFVAAGLLLAYAASTGDPIFIAGPVVSVLVFARNLRLTRLSREDRPAAGSPLFLLAPVLVLFGVLATLGVSAKLGKLEATTSIAWLVVGLVGQELWSTRNVIQWWVSERQGHSVLPPAYFAVSTLGAMLLLTYAIHRVDWVFMAAYALNPIPYARNLWLSLRAQEQDEEGQTPEDADADPTTAAGEPAQPSLAGEAP